MAVLRSFHPESLSFRMETKDKTVVSQVQQTKDPYIQQEPSCLILIGMPGSGKSTLGRLLCAGQSCVWVDTDFLMQAWWGMPLQAILDHLGLEGFLDAEAELVSSINLRQAVISTGGSVVHRPRAMQHLGSLGRIVYLRAGPDVISKRISDARDRGMAVEKGLSLEQVYCRRRPLYEKYAELILDTDEQTPAQCVEVIRQWQQKLKN